MGKNAYFQLVIKPEGTFLRLYPAQDGGEALKFEEVITYLVRQNISGFPIADVNKAVNGQEETEIKLLNQAVYPVQEEMRIVMSQDKMEGIARFYPPSDNAAPMDRAEIIRGIAYQGVKHGMIEEAVDKFVAERSYCTDYVIARGTPVQEGTDAEITYHFNLKPNARPKLNEDGSVDFHKLETINGVREGMELATLKKEVQGIMGRDISGTAIFPKSVAVKRLLPGRNTYLSEDGTQLFSSVNGHVILDNNERVVVSNVFEIKGDVDTSIGDIDYDGDVKISGNVLSGFSVYATGDVEVDGVVEAANITAGGRIVIKRGIQGMNKGVLRAGGNILCRFIESAVVRAGGSIEADAIMHSEVSAKSEIHVAGKKGLIVGGNVRAGMLIESMTIGSPMGSATSLAVGDDPELQDRIQKLEEEKRRLETEENRIRQVLEAMKIKKKQGTLSSDQIEILQKIALNYTELRNRMEAAEKEISECYDEVAETKGAKIIARNIVYSGVKLMIAGEFTITSTEYHFCKFVKDWHEVKRVSL